MGRTFGGRGLHLVSLNAYHVVALQAEIAVTAVAPDNQHNITRLPDSMAAMLRWYQRDLHWQVELIGEHIVYPLTGGVVAFSASEDLVAPLLQRLRANSVVVPVLEYNDGDTANAIVLADADGSVWSQVSLPAGTRFLSAPTKLVLPSGQRHTGVRWLRKPSVLTPWLPTAQAVGEVIKQVAKSGYAFRPMRSGREVKRRPSDYGSASRNQGTPQSR